MPANHTPHKSPTALSSFCKLESRVKVWRQHHSLLICHLSSLLTLVTHHVWRAQELLPTEGASLVPSLQLLEDFCHKTVIKSAMAHLQGLIKDSVTAVHPHDFPADDEDEPGSGILRLPIIAKSFGQFCQNYFRAINSTRFMACVCECADGCRVSLASGRTIITKAVVYCSSPTVPVWPTWVQPDTFPAANAEQASTQLPDANGQQASAKVPLIQHATDVLVSQTAVSGRAVVIVGGGMTSAQLALRACSGGAASTTLICRHKLCVRALDCKVLCSHLLIEDQTQHIFACYMQIAELLLS